MSDIIPPILSSTPPPLADIADDDDDFGDFAVADDPFQADTPDAEPGKEIAWNDDGLNKTTDNTSQESVLSGNTDSGLCSDSSPLPGLESNCDQHPVSCDVPLSKSITEAQCDLPKTSTNRETIHIPLNTSVNCAKDDEVKSSFDSQHFNGNLDSSDDQYSIEPSQIINHTEEGCNFKGNLNGAENEIADSSSTVNDQNADCNENLPADIIKTDIESSFEIDWKSLNRNSLNDVNASISKDFDNGATMKDSSQNESEVNVQDANLNYSDVESRTIFNLERSNFETETGRPTTPENYHPDDSKAYLEEEKANVLSHSAFAPFAPNSVQTDDSIPTNSADLYEPPPIPSDMDLQMPSDDDVDEITESFGEIEASPTSQIVEDPAHRCRESSPSEESEIIAPSFEATGFPAFETSSVPDFDAFGNSAPAGDDDWALPETNFHVEAAGDDDDDFGDFEEAGDDDGFGQFETSTAEVQEPVKDDEDNFSELFGDSEKILEMVEEIYECDSPLGPPMAMSALSSHLKHLWPEIQDVQNTPALEYQWTNSRSQEHLLSSLGIDSRNILYGHQLNSSMPRFAANLGNCPLEPMKAAESGPTANPLVPEQENVPAAQFDWSGSGLVNPLDCEKQSVKKGLSAAAKKVLSSLPDLSFMRAASLPRTQV